MPLLFAAFRLIFMLLRYDEESRFFSLYAADDIFSRRLTLSFIFMMLMPLLPL